jgi:hypothetical protein
VRAILQDHKMWPSCDIYDPNNFPSDMVCYMFPISIFGTYYCHLKDWLGNYDDIDEIGFKDEKLTTLDVINPCGWSSTIWMKTIIFNHKCNFIHVVKFHWCDTIHHPCCQIFIQNCQFSISNFISFMRNLTCVLNFTNIDSYNIFIY